MIYAPQGRGKTSLAQQLVNARIGVGERELLGFPVKPAKRVLYLAMDRPQQIARSWRRMVSDDDRDVLSERLVVWQGSLPFRLTWESADVLGRWAIEDHEADVIVVDSYKDLSPDLSNEETGALINRIMQDALVQGVDWVGLHHGRKSSTGNKRPNALDDVYGSKWITSGMGSVIGLWSEDAGSELVQFTHLKQPNETIEPFTISHDHATGTSTRLDLKGGVPTGDDKPSSHKRTIINALMSVDSITPTDAQRLLGLKERATRDVLKALEEDGILQASATGRDRTWSLVR
jgi:replicative DNA helicase